MTRRKAKFICICDNATHLSKQEAYNRGWRFLGSTAPSCPRCYKARLVYLHSKFEGDLRSYLRSALEG